MADDTRCEDEVTKAICWLEDHNAVGVCRDAVIVSKFMGYRRLDRKVYPKEKVEAVLADLSFVHGGTILLGGRQYKLKVRLPSLDMTDDETKSHLREIRGEVKERWGIERKERGKNKVIEYKGLIKALESTRGYDRLIGVSLDEFTVTLTFPTKNRAFQAANVLLKLVDKK